MPSIALDDWKRRRASDYPGAKLFRDLFLSREDRKLRPYQVAAVGQCAATDAIIEGDPMRSGKTPTLLATLVLRGVARVLVICTAGGRLGWAEEIKAWRPTAKVVHLFGRGADKLRIYGERRYLFRAKHRDAFDAALTTADYVIVNYELLIGQTAYDDAGGLLGVHDHLPGWCGRLQEANFGAAILDEGSSFLTSDPTRSSENSIRDAVLRVIGEATIPIVYEADGTPCRGGRPRAYWGQLDAISGGLWGVDRRGRRMPFTFQARHCDGHHAILMVGFDERGQPRHRQIWKADGSTRENEPELKERLGLWIIQRPRSLILPYMPTKQRQTKWVEVDPLPPLPPEGLELKSKVSRMLAQTIDAKISAMLPEAVEELEQGAKLIVYCFRKRSVRMVAKAFEKIFRGQRTGALLRAANARLWVCVGPGAEEDDGEGNDRGPTLNPTQRHAMAKEFRTHNGAGVVIATISSLRGVYNMPDESGDHPVTTEHWMETHPSPDTMLQAEDRPYVPEFTRGLSIVTWAVVGSYDEHAIRRLIPQVETLHRLQTDGGADGMADALRRTKPEQNFRAIMADLIAARKANTDGPL